MPDNKRFGTLRSPEVDEPHAIAAEALVQLTRFTGECAYGSENGGENSRRYTEPKPRDEAASR